MKCIVYSWSSLERLRLRKKQHTKKKKKHIKKTWTKSCKLQSISTAWIPEESFKVRMVSSQTVGYEYVKTCGTLSYFITLLTVSGLSKFGRIKKQNDCQVTFVHCIRPGHFKLWWGRLDCRLSYQVVMSMTWEWLNDLMACKLDSLNKHFPPEVLPLYPC